MGTTYTDLVAANLRAARARANLSQPDVSARMIRLGFTTWDPTKVSACERGKRPVQLGELLGLAVVLDCAIAELVGSNTAPDVTVTFPAGQEVSGVSVRNSVYGWRDGAMIWRDGDLVIMRPVDPQSARTWDQASIVAVTDPGRLARQAG
jgi:hypothetical protein